MPSRVLALLLAVVLFWSGLSTFEAQGAAAQRAPGPSQSMGMAGGPSALDDGSIEDHHLDDLPFQAQGDPSFETPGLLAAAPAALVPSLVMVVPQALAPSAAGAPWLAGPLRPPCCTASQA